MRKALIYPPYCDMVLVGLSGIDEDAVRSASVKFFGLIKNKLNSQYKDLKLIILGPMTARVIKVNNKYRYRIIIKCKNSNKLRKMLAEVLKEYESYSSNKPVSAFIDINPENIL